MQETLKCRTWKHIYRQQAYREDVCRQNTHKILSPVTRKPERTIQYTTIIFACRTQQERTLTTVQNNYINDRMSFYIFMSVNIWCVFVWIMYDTVYSDTK